MGVLLSVSIASYVLIYRLPHNQYELHAAKLVGQPAKIWQYEKILSIYLSVFYVDEKNLIVDECVGF